MTIVTEENAIHYCCMCEGDVPATQVNYTVAVNFSARLIEPGHEDYDPDTELQHDYAEEIYDREYVCDAHGESDLAA